MPNGDGGPPEYACKAWMYESKGTLPESCSSLSPIFGVKLDCQLDVQQCCKSNACLYGSLPCMDVNVNLVIDCSYRWCTLQAGRKEYCDHVTQ